MTRGIASGLAVAVAVTVAPALAAETKFPTRPSIEVKRKANGDLFKGAVRSDAHACEAKRKVRLFHRNVSEQAKTAVLAKFRTNGEGKWDFRPAANVNGDRYATPGDYHVEVGEKRVSTGGGEIVCKDRSSPSIFVG